MVGLPIDSHQAKSSADYPKEILDKCTTVDLRVSPKSPDSLASFFNSVSQSAINSPAMSPLIKA